jgi:hypothetical protein
MAERYTDQPADQAAAAPDDISYVELIDDLSFGGPINTSSVTAFLLDNSGAVVSDSNVTVYVPMGMPQFSYGNTTAVAGASGWRGAIGQAQWNARRNALELTYIQPMASRIRVSIGTGCVAAGATLTTTAVAVMDPGAQDPSFGTGVMSSSTTYWVVNYGAQIGSADGGTTGIIAVWDQSQGCYLVIDAPCADSSC